MSVETQPFLRSAALLERALRVIFGVVLLSGGVVAVWMIVDTPALGQMLAGNIGYGMAELRDWQSHGLAALVLVQIGIWAAVVWQGRQIFAALGTPDLVAATRAARIAARLLWIMLIWGVLAHALGSVVATWHFPDGQRALAISVGSAEISTIIAALLATFTAHAFVLGAALWQDHREVI
ncbi:hypothetical protein [Tropicimonas sp. S265A]|uniref:hypothetical protein n=1 Tax=Tropicimonas sp. S265A TaxID=3415134 RepID=UPI003C7AD39B